MLLARDDRLYQSVYQCPCLTFGLRHFPTRTRRTRSSRRARRQGPAQSRVHFRDSGCRRCAGSREPPIRGFLGSAPDGGGASADEFVPSLRTFSLFSVVHIDCLAFDLLGCLRFRFSPRSPLRFSSPHALAPLSSVRFQPSRIS